MRREKYGLCPIGKWGSLCSDHVHTGRPAVLLLHLLRVEGLVKGSYVLCLSQVQVVANPAEPYKFQIQYSEMALHNSYKPSLLLIYYRTGILNILDGQLERKCAGNK